MQLHHHFDFFPRPSWKSGVFQDNNFLHEDNWSFPYPDSPQRQGYNSAVPVLYCGNNQE